MAVAVGFEPTVESPLHAFEACSFSRSDTPPTRVPELAALTEIRSGAIDATANANPPITASATLGDACVIASIHRPRRRRARVGVCRRSRAAGPNALLLTDPADGPPPGAARGAPGVGPTPIRRLPPWGPRPRRRCGRRVPASPPRRTWRTARKSPRACTVNRHDPVCRPPPRRGRLRVAGRVPLGFTHVPPGPDDLALGGERRHRSGRRPTRPWRTPRRGRDRATAYGSSGGTATGLTR